MIFFVLFVIDLKTSGTKTELEELAAVFHQNGHLNTINVKSNDSFIRGERSLRNKFLVI